MRTLHYMFGPALWVIALSMPCAWAQEKSQDQPIPAYRSPLASAANEGDTEEAGPQKLAPDDRPLAGAQDLSVGVPSTNHSYWEPHVDLSGSFYSNPPIAGTHSGWTNWTNVFGGFDLHRNSGNSALTLSYLGGGAFSNSTSQGSGIVQDLNFADTITFRRASVSFFDQLSYSPESNFGSSGFGGIPLPPIGTPGLGSSFIPNQGILTTFGQRVTNSFLTQVNFSLTPRSSLTVVSGYNLLHFFDSTNFDYGNVIFQGGYNYRISRTDTIAVSYQYSGFSYDNANQSINTHTVQGSYGRQITGQLAFQISAGPQISTFTIPITGTSGNTGGTSPSPSTEVHWSLYSSLQYQLGRTGLTASYSHGVTGGSGVLAGALTDIISGSAFRQLSRTFSGSWNLGYSRNNGLAVNGAANANQTYNYWITGATLNHSWGRSLNMFMSYQLQYQNSNSSFCVRTTCSTSYVGNIISFGIGWHRQPIPF